MTTELYVGVKELQIFLGSRCQKHKEHCAKINVSFTLAGTFLPAAKSDSLKDTVDYDALCNTLARDLSGSACLDLDSISQLLCNSIRQFSSKISGGYVNIHRRCHEPFIVRQALL